MADTIRRADYFYTHVQDAPGEGLKVLTRLRESGVNLLAFSAFPAAGGRTQVDLVPENPEAFEKACRTAGIELSGRKSCFLVAGADRAGAVADIVKRLTDAKINITALDAVAAGAGRFGAILWVKPESQTAAIKALGL